MLPQNLTDQQIEEIGMVDILIVPVGGYGYTLEPKQAVEVVRAIEPKIVIPVHYDDQVLNTRFRNLLWMTF